ncbi:carbohydrate ABC transporter permease [Microbacterium murale]|uniref:Multiple sugar transport system permease protein n=1 Tax=Microbacterium murale TaxID=1081040 RepID=A0ABU0P778_9MICO|nr:sugar ABC transporter permease [Microbacterium murale]MDQ0643190.1 multiple sugar transport system permease protein [Microbacterium murale]
MQQATLDRPATSERVEPRSGRRSTLGAKDRTFGFMIALPAVLLFLVIAIYPLVSSIGTSLYDQSLLRPERTFVGFGNYTSIFGEFAERLGTTLVFSSLSTIFPLILGVALAILLNARIRGRTILRGALMLPWLLPGVVVSFLWAWIFNDSYGVLNHLLSMVGLPEVSMLGNPAGAMAAVVIAKTWHSFPWIMVVALAVLQTLPSEQIEAATIDGATRSQRFRYISLPHIVGPVTLVAVLEFIYNFGNFDTIFVMTGGGPGDSTTTLALSLYQLAFGSYELGKASAMGVLWLVLLAIISSGYLFLNRRLEK